MKISIVIPTMTLSLFQKCWTSIREYTSMEDVEVIVVANGADPALWDYANDLSTNGLSVSILWYPEALGPVPAYNIGIKEAIGDFIVLMNDDTAILPSAKNEWLEMLSEPFKDPKVMVTGPLKMDHVIGNNNNLLLNQEDASYGFIVFFLAMIRREAFDEIGLLDETLKCGVDSDFCMKLKRAGYLIEQVPNETIHFDGSTHMIGNFPIFHEGEGTVHKFYGMDKWGQILRDDTEILRNRYGTKQYIENLISIVIPTYGDSFNVLSKCVNSVIEHTSSNNVEVIIVANGCTEEVRDYVDSSKVINNRVLWFNQPIGFCSAVNAGVKSAHGDIIVLLNHDTVILGKEWLNMLTEPFSNPKVGITGPVLGECSLIDRNFVMFFCAAIRKEVFNQIGLLDTVYDPGGLDDVDFCVRAEDVGWTIVRVPDYDVVKHSPDGFSGSFPIYHMEHHDDWMSDEILQRNSKILINRYNKIDRPIIQVDWPVWQKKYELLMVQELLRHEKIEKVLEIGTAHGGSTLLWSKMVESVGGHVYTCDFPSDTGTMIDETHYRGMVTQFRGNSHDPALIKRIRSEAGSIDLLFIDGDHSYEGVKQDFENFYDLVRDGGFIILHDIIDSVFHHEVDCYVSVFWNEIKDKHYSLEFIDPNKYNDNIPMKSMGIGVIQKGMKPESSKEPSLEVMDINGKDVLCSICTKNRYDSTLPLALQSICMQNVKPGALVIYDDNTDSDRRDLRENETYRYLFDMLNFSGIEWEVVFGAQKGQHHGHQFANKKGCKYIWRLDDDEIAAPDVLEKYLRLMDDSVGAVGGTVLTQGYGGEGSNKIEHIYSAPNIQWSVGNEVVEVDHLHSTFLYRANIVDYNLELSPVAHREETIFTYELKQKGYRILVDRSAITHHLKQQSTGIRSHNSAWFYEHDERVFTKKMESWGYKLINLDSGIGDHLAFLNILPDLKKKWKHLIIGACFPEVFQDHPDVTLIHIAQSAPINDENIYKWMWDNNWKTSIVDAYATYYEVK